MKLRRSLLFSLASFTLVLGTACGGSVATPTTSASPVAAVPSPSPAAIDCLVGTWIEGSNPKWDGTPGFYPGVRMTIAADGSVIKDYNSTPVFTGPNQIGFWNVYRGTQTLRVTVDNGWLNFTPVHVQVTETDTHADGSPIMDNIENVGLRVSMTTIDDSNSLWTGAGRAPYTCSATALHFVNIIDGTVETSFTRA